MVSLSVLLFGVSTCGPLTVSTILSGMLLWNFASGSSEILPCTRCGLSAEAGDPPPSSEYPRRPRPASTNTAAANATKVLRLPPDAIFFMVFDLLPRSDTMVDSETLSPVCDISITKRSFVGNGWASGAQVLLRRYNLARDRKSVV